MRATRPAHGRRRWLGLAALVLTAGALVPAALALACNPQAYLTLDKAQYAPGDTVRVSGSFFKGDVNITVSIDRSGQSTTVRTAANGSFQTTFALPSNASTGGYTMQAIGFEANGEVTPGLPARGSFSVATAQTAPQPAPSGSEQTAPQPSGSAAPTGQPAASQATQPSASRPASGFREPSVINEPDVQTSRTQRSTTSRGGAAGRDRATVSGRTVFGGSVAPAASARATAPAAGASVTAAPSDSARAVRPRGSSESRAVSRQTAEQTATDDVWSALGSGRSPSVLPFAGDGVAVSSPRAGSQLALGLLLVGGGVLALIGGLAAGEARRRRVRVR